MSSPPVSSDNRTTDLYDQDGDSTSSMDESLGSEHDHDDGLAHESQQYDDQPSRYANDSQYDNLSTRHEDGSRDGDRSTRDEVDSLYDPSIRYEDDFYYDDQSTRYEDDDSRHGDRTTQYDENYSTTYTEDDSSRWHGDAPPPIRQEYTQEPQVPPIDPLDDPMAHPLENPHLPRRPRATEPGVVAVIRRGRRDSEDEWDPTSPEEPSLSRRASSRNYLDAAIAPAMKNMREMSTKRIIIYATIFTVVLVALCVGIAYGVNSRDESSDGSDIDSEPPETLPCDFTNVEQPSPLSQCACEGEINVLSDELLSNYIELKESFVPTLYEEFDYLIESCEPQNVALLWMATDTAEERSLERMQNRYLLSVLYASWKGLEWTNDEGWLTSAPECTWAGITCVGTVISVIDLFDNNLQGSLVTELGFFTGLGK